MKSPLLNGVNYKFIRRHDGLERRRFIFAQPYYSSNLNASATNTDPPPQQDSKFSSTDTDVITPIMKPKARCIESNDLLVRACGRISQAVVNAIPLSHFFCCIKPSENLTVSRWQNVAACASDNSNPPIVLQQKQPRLAHAQTKSLMLATILCFLITYGVFINLMSAGRPDIFMH